LSLQASAAMQVHAGALVRGRMQLDIGLAGCLLDFRSFSFERRHEN
jgi:hypothetical protein